MKYGLVIIIIVFLVAGLFAYNLPADPKATNNPSKSMNLSSPAFKHNSLIPLKYTCDGQGFNPPLDIIDVPPEAKSLVLVVDDPDAPLSGGFVHWVVFNFDPKTQNISENSFPPGATEGQNSSAQSKYVAPCPPTGTHRYFFKLYALDTKLSLDSSAKREDVEKAMDGHIIDQTELIGLYKR